MRANALLGLAVAVLGALLVVSLTFTYLFWQDARRTECDYQRVAAHIYKHPAPAWCP
jgi:uncharacterized membrane protein YccC